MDSGQSALAAGPWLAARAPARHPARAVLLAWCALVLLFSRAQLVGSDAYWYVEDIRETLSRGWSAEPRQLWDFAHLLWRPLGVVLARWFRDPLTPVWGREQAAIAFLLILVSAAAAVVSCWLVQSAVWKWTGRPWVATLAGAALLGFNPVLNNSREATSYLLAFALSFAALYLAGFTTSGHPVWAGVLAALAAALWAPMAVSTPAVWLARPLLWPGGWRVHRRHLVWLATACALTVAVVFGGVGWFAAQVHSVAEFQEWMARGAADVEGVRDRLWLRMGSGLARSFYNLGQDAVWLKWYLFRDPYARVSLLEVFQASLARLLLYYVTLALVLLGLWRDRRDRRLVGLLAVLAVPHLGLALRYESGSAERYLALLGLLAIGLGALVGNPRWGRARLLAGALALAPAVLNIGLAAAEDPLEHAVRRITPLTGIPEGSRVYVTGLRDELVQLRYSGLLHPVHNLPLPRIESLEPFGAFSWRLTLACGVRAAWESGGTVWMTARILAPEPRREWLWVDGDHPALRWADLHALAQRLELGERRGGDDGFFLAPETAANRAVFEQLRGVAECSAP